MSHEHVDASGRRRSPATEPGYFAGRASRNKGRRYPADPPRVEEIVAVMRAAGPGVCATRLRGLIVTLWRAGLRVGEALALAESDLDQARGAILVRHGKGDKRREVGMDDWAWGQPEPWLAARASYAVEPLFCVVVGPTAGGPWSSTAVRSEFRRVGRRGGVRRRFAPHQLRHAHAVEWLGKPCLSTSFNASFDARTSASRRSISGDRQRRDHRCRSRSSRADDQRERRVAALAGLLLLVLKRKRADIDRLAIARCLESSGQLMTQ